MRITRRRIDLDVKRYVVVEQIIIREDAMEIEFKCGVSVKKEYVR